MLSNTYILLMALLVCAALLLLRELISLIFEKVRITTFNGKSGSTLIGILDYSNNTDNSVTGKGQAAVVRLIGASRSTPYIGRVALDNTHRAVVSVLDSDLELDAENPLYRTYGYIDENGYIHEKVRNQDLVIGFTARPSEPNKPTIYGERHWYSFWQCTLNVYKGAPQTDAAADPKPTLVAECVREGHHFGEDRFPAEARACGYAMFFPKMRNTKDYSDYYTNPPHYWKDTALLAAIVYSVIYLILFFVNTVVTNVPLFGRDIIGMVILTAFYFIIWDLVRQFKITKGELSNSIKPQLDLLNKNIGIKMSDWAIVVISGLLVGMCYAFYEFETLIKESPDLASIMFLLDYGHYDFDFLPIVWVVSTALFINRSQPNVPLPWRIHSVLTDENDDEEDEDVRNPRGKIDVTYDWDLDSFYNNSLHGQVTLHFDKEEYIDQLRLVNPFYPQVLDVVSEKVVHDMYAYLLSKPKTMRRLKYLAFYISDLAAHVHLPELDKLQFTLDFVQEPNIAFREDRDSKSLDYAIHYMRFPDETLFDKEGDYDCKAFLASMLFYAMGYNVLFLYSEHHKTAAIAIEISVDLLATCMDVPAINEITTEVNGHTYVYCEVAAENFKIGHIDDGKSIRDFNIKVPMTHGSEEGSQFDSGDVNFDDSIPNAEDKTVDYEWTLDSRFGKQLTGKFSLQFRGKYIDMLRANNPFATYGKDGRQMDTNLRIMYNYMRSDDQIMQNLKQLANYIHTVSSDNDLNHVDTIQFILDFVQEPNIKYCLDSNSEELNRPKEYTRFPDETLYDKKGDCDCKTMLAVALFSACGYKSLFLISSVYEHAALAVACNSETMALLKGVVGEDIATIDYKGKTFLFCETTGDGFKIGQISEGNSTDKFEFIIDFSA